MARAPNSSQILFRICLTRSSKCFCLAYHFIGVWDYRRISQTFWYSWEGYSFPRKQAQVIVVRSLTSLQQQSWPQFFNLQLWYDLGNILTRKIAAKIDSCQSVFMLFSGFLIVRSAVPDFWLFLYYSSYFRYGIFFLSTSQLEALGDKLMCTKGAITLPPDACRASFYSQFSMNPDDRAVYLGVMIGCLIAFRILCLIIVKKFKHIAR
jgi:hypothetical protein